MFHDQGPFASFLPLVKRGLPSETGTLHEPKKAIPFASGSLSSGTELKSYFGYAQDTGDFFCLVILATTDIEVHLTGIPAGSNHDLYLYGTDDMGLPKSLFAVSQQGSSPDESLVANQAPAGLYQVRVQNLWRVPSSQLYTFEVAY